MTTDNRTNEPTEAQVEAAAIAFEEHLPLTSGVLAGTGTYWCAECRKNIGPIDTARRHALSAALVAAQSAAPQAEAYDHCCLHPKCPGGSLCCCVSERRMRDCWNQWREEIAGGSRQAFRDGYQAGRNDPAPWLTAPVLPSSGVDEDKLAEVLLKHSPSATDSGGFAACRCDRTWRSREGNAAHVARAVAAWLEGQGGESRG